MIAVLGFALAHAGSAAAQTYVACGYGTTVALGSGGSSCMSLPDAISAAESHFGNDTIQMLPGTYCPIDLEGNLFDGIDFVGVGLAGIDTSGGPVEIDGPEAGITAFKYDAVHCGTAPNAVVQVNAFVNPGPGIRFDNLTIDASGANDGLLSQGSVDVSLRDVIVENASTYGVFYQSGFSAFHDYSLDVSHSALLDNNVGVEVAGFGSVYASTVSGNTTGVLVQNSDMSLGSDTIAHNTYGVDSPCCGNSLQVVNSVNADNTLDCRDSVDWESLSSGHNLLDDTTCFPRAASDIVDNTVSVADVALNGGPTPSILPPHAAQGTGDTICGLDGADQREYGISGTCDVGAVQQDASGSANVVAPGQDLGDIDTGSQANATVSVSNNGGDVQGISNVSVSAGWTITNDTCTYQPLAHNQGCSVSIKTTPSADGPDNATVTLESTAGTLHSVITATAVTRATGTDDSYYVTGDSLTVPAPGILGNDQDGVSIDEVLSQPSDGTLTGPAADGSFTYTPNPGFLGDDSFQYTVIDDGLFESHPITVTLHVVGFTVTLDQPSYSTDPGGSFQPSATITPLRGFSGDVCLAIADLNGNTPSWLSPGTNFPTCNNDDARVDVSVSGAPTTVPLPVNVASNATPGAFTLEVLASASSGPAPDYAQTFQLGVGAINPPVISIFRPVNVGVGTTVTIYGSNFTGVTAVKFNGVDATSFTYLNDGEVTAVVPTTSSGKIQLTTPLGTTLSPDPYTFFAAPHVNTLSAASANVGDTVTIGGTSLNGATSVTLHGTHVPFTVLSSSQITFTVPAGATSGTVTVITPGGTSTSAGSITIGPPPTITSFTPGTGTVGTPVTITGTNLQNVVGVEIGHIVTVPTSVSSTQVVFTIPPGAVSGPITLLAANGSVTSIDTLTITG